MNGRSRWGILGSGGDLSQMRSHQALPRRDLLLSHCSLFIRRKQTHIYSIGINIFHKYNFSLWKVFHEPDKIPPVGQSPLLGNWPWFAPPFVARELDSISCPCLPLSTTTFSSLLALEWLLRHWFNLSSTFQSQAPGSECTTAVLACRSSRSMVG